MKAITSTIVSAITAISFSFAAAPVAADEDDLAKIIAGLVAAGIVVNVIKNKNEKKNEQQVHTQLPRFGSYEYEDNVVNGRLVDPNKGARLLRRAKNSALPAKCLRTLETRGQDRGVYTESCLKKRYQYSQQLPKHCQFKVRSRGKIHKVFGAQCLAQDGWKTASYKR